MKRPRKPSKSKVIFAWRGEKVTGPQGKVVAIVRRDLYRHRLTNIDDFEWLIDPPGLKSNVKDTPGFRELTDGRPQVCIDGEWRPELSPVGG